MQDKPEEALEVEVVETETAEGAKIEIDPKAVENKAIENENPQGKRPMSGVFIINGAQAEKAGSSLKEDIMLAIRSLF
ncbi:MAG: hypothetical protein RR315_00075 [Oscillospiraceae bacterium]